MFCSRCSFAYEKEHLPFSFQCLGSHAQRHHGTEITKLVCPSAPKVIPNSALQLARSLAQQVSQILQVVARGNSKLPDKVLRGGLQVAVLLAAVLFLGAAEVGVGRDGRGAFESLQPALRLGLRAGVEGALAEELVR